jgi:hypothetical protein
MRKGLRVIICGGRDYNKQQFLFRKLDELQIEHGPFDTVIHGDAPGADRLAHNWALLRGITVVPVPAEWDRHGKAAGPIRNRRMLSDYDPDLVIAFPGHAGTDDMMRQADAAGVEVMEIKDV